MASMASMLELIFLPAVLTLDIQHRLSSISTAVLIFGVCTAVLIFGLCTVVVCLIGTDVPICCLCTAVLIVSSLHSFAKFWYLRSLRSCAYFWSVHA